MRYLKYITFLLLLSYSGVSAQLKEEHKQKLAQFLVENMNTHRLSLRKSTLEPHKDLMSAAMLHSKWMVKKKN